MKLLVVNKQNPNETHYHSPKTFGSWILGRRLSNYIFILVKENENELLELVSSEVFEVQDQINRLFNITEKATIADLKTQPSHKDKVVKDIVRDMGFDFDEHLNPAIFFAAESLYDKNWRKEED